VILEKLKKCAIYCIKIKIFSFEPYFFFFFVAFLAGFLTGLLHVITLL